MNNSVISPEQAIDDALKKACLLVFLVSSPAFFINVYRNLLLDFLPIHVTIISTVWVGFYLLSSKLITSSYVRYYSLLGFLLTLFFISGFRNQSILAADIFIIIFGGLLALRQSTSTILFVAVAATTGAYLIIDEQFLSPDLSFELHVALHTCTLLLSFVLYSAIRNVVSNFESLYELQTEVNINLVNKNKQSHLWVQDAEESKGNEKQRLRTTAYNIYSQISTLQNITKFATETDDIKLLDDSNIRMEDIKCDLLEFYNSGKYVSSKTTKLKIPELVHILENHIRPYAMASSDVLNLFVTSREKDTAEFEFPIQYLKLLTHHTIQHNLKKYQTKELKFDIRKGLKTLSMQQIKISVFIILNLDLPEADVSTLNREMDKKIDLPPGDNHISFMRILLRGMSGSFEAHSMGKTVRYEISFWVDI